MIALVGFMGAGKTTVGRLVARRLEAGFVDVDEAVVEELGESIPDAFESKGETYFRRIEREVALRALSGSDGVVALGGGSVQDPLVRGALRSATVVHLEVALDVALRRAGDPASRPLLARGDTTSLFEERRALYERVADSSVDASGPPEEVAERIASAYTAPDPISRDVARVEVATSPSYDVVVGSGLIERVFDLVEPPAAAEKAFVITQDALRGTSEAVERAAKGAGLQPVVLTIPDGEQAKSLATVERLFGELGDARAHRNDVVVSLGGGVVTDTAGFVASTFNRGMPLVNVPTTLLAQVDAAVGGKTGVNLSYGKNLVGTFYQPRGVVCDVGTLESLPDDEFVSGLAEVVKYGLIGDVPLGRFVLDRSDAILARDQRTLVHLVSHSVADKAQIVEADERETGVRAHLNYGHTFAHAIERIDDYSGMRHGEAVAVGMMAAAHLAHEMGRIGEACVDLHRRLLTAVGLPTSASLDLDALEGAWAHDKKFERGARFVLLRRDGVGPDLAAEGFASPEAGVRVHREALQRAIDRLVT